MTSSPRRERRRSSFAATTGPSDRQRPARLVSLLGHGSELHRAGLAVGEPVRRVIRLAPARRVAVGRAVRHTARGAGLDRRLEARIQHLPAAQQSWLAIAGRLRYGLEGGEPSGPTLITGGPMNGVRSRALTPTHPRVWASSQSESEATKNAPMGLNRIGSVFRVCPQVFA
jgi:hypothetical protein